MASNATNRHNEPKFLLAARDAAAAATGVGAAAIVSGLTFTPALTAAVVIGSAYALMGVVRRKD
jgi:hypothetical protein